MLSSIFFVSGDPAVAKATVNHLLTQRGFTLRYSDPATGLAERGSKGATIAVGAFSGKSQHLRVRLSFRPDPYGNTAVSLASDTTGIAAGLIGVGRANEAYSELFGAIRATFAMAGVLLGEQVS
ncbi:MAG: hypothetical protein LBJ62_05475 [Bifidobacteriaceae bacterium]|jgi:hypothetical protein|nr:hypothetical protein [Bifidobacteriaceae bacterium]